MIRQVLRMESPQLREISNNDISNCIGEAYAEAIHFSPSDCSKDVKSYTNGIETIFWDKNYDTLVIRPAGEYCIVIKKGRATREYSDSSVTVLRKQENIAKRVYNTIFKGNSYQSGSQASAFARDVLVPLLEEKDTYDIRWNDHHLLLRCGKNEFVEVPSPKTHEKVNRKSVMQSLKKSIDYIVGNNHSEWEKTEIRLGSDFLLSAYNIK